MPEHVPFENMNRDAQILTWDATQKQLTQLKAQEMEMRKIIIEGGGQGIDAAQIGTQNVDLGNGYKLKAVIKETFTLDTDADKVNDVLDTFEDWQAERLVKWSARLMKKEYDELSQEQRSKLDGILTIKKAAPALTLVAPKGA